MHHAHAVAVVVRRARETGLRRRGGGALHLLVELAPQCTEEEWFGRRGGWRGRVRVDVAADADREQAVQPDLRLRGLALHAEHRLRPPQHAVRDQLFARGIPFGRVAVDERACRRELAQQARRQVRRGDEALRPGAAEEAAAFDDEHLFHGALGRRRRLGARRFLAQQRAQARERRELALVALLLDDLALALDGDDARIAGAAAAL